MKVAATLDNTPNGNVVVAVERKAMPDWYKVCKVDQLEEGQPLGLQVGDKHVGLFRLADRCYAINNICTHEFAILSEGWQEGEIIECPLHQARFRITDGKCMGPPAETDLQTFDVKLQDGNVYVLLD